MDADKIDQMMAEAKAKGPEAGRPSYAYTTTENGRTAKYFILWGKWHKEARSRNIPGEQGTLMAPYLIEDAEGIIYKLDRAASDLKYIVKTDSMPDATWERIAVADVPRHLNMPSEEWDTMHGITPFARKEMESRLRLMKAMETLIKNRGKLQLKHSWATTEPYCSELEDEPSYLFVDETGHTCEFNHFRGFEVEYKLSRYSDQLGEAWETDTPMSEPVKFSYNKYSAEACTYCGQSEFLTDGFKIWAEKPCPYPDGIDCKITLDVPSGKVVIGNDFRDVFPGKTSEDFNVNASHGVLSTIRDYEADKMIHFFVGNSSPDIYVTGDNELMVANSPSEDIGEFVEDKWEYLENPSHTEFLKGKKDIGGVCTDLWWVSMVDGDEAVSRGMNITPEAGPGWTEYVHFDCEPGRYEVDYFGMLKKFDRDDYENENGIVYATMRRVGDVPA